MQWAIDSDVFIQPVIQMEDKDNIGTFLGQAPDHLKFVGNIDWILLIRSDVDFWNVCVKKISKSVEINQVLSNKMKEMYAASKRQLALADADQSQASTSGETKATDTTYDLFLSHKQNDVNPELKARMKDVAKLLNEHFTGRKIRCFLDKNFNGNSWNDLPNLVACSKTIVVLLSEKFVESPWCVLELLSAVMHKRPIAFMKMSNSFKFALLRKQLVAIGFPFVEALDQFSVEIDYSETYFKSAMDKVVERMQANTVTHSLSLSGGSRSVTCDEVAKQYEILRDVRNKSFPEKRSWPSWSVGAVDVSNSNVGGLASSSSAGETKTSRVRV